MSMRDGTVAAHFAAGKLDAISSRRLGHYLRADRVLPLPSSGG